MPPIRTGLDERLKTIRNELQIYFDEAKNAYSDAINAFTKLDSEVYSEVKKVRAKAREINWDLTNDLLLILAINQPLMGDLRIVACYLRAVDTVERLVRHARDIAKSDRSLDENADELPEVIVESVLEMHSSLDKLIAIISSCLIEIIEVPEDLDASLKPYIIQPSGQNLDGIMKCIQNKVDAIDRITHMGSVRATGNQIASGIALQTEFQLLNARLSEKADYLENAEEQIWGLFAKWQDKEWNGKVNYPDTFDIRDWANDLQYLQMAKASGIKSETFNKEIDKQIAEAVIDDSEMMKTINDEIDATRTVRGQFTTTEVEGQTVEEEET